MSSWCQTPERTPSHRGAARSATRRAPRCVPERFAVIPYSSWCSGTQECLDRAALVHGAVAVGDLLERQREIEHLARVDRPVEDQVDQFGKIAAHRRRATVKTDVTEEQVCAVQHHTVRHADVADRSARTRDPDGLLHRFLGPHTLEYRVRADAPGQFLDALDALVTAFGDDIGGPELSGKLLP